MTREPTEMETRVAKALDDVIDGWYDAQSRTYTVDLARAAIQAMREPTTEMLSGYNSFLTQIENWQAIIDAASPQEE